MLKSTILSGLVQMYEKSLEEEEKDQRNVLRTYPFDKRRFQEGQVRIEEIRTQLNIWLTAMMKDEFPNFKKEC